MITDAYTTKEHWNDYFCDYSPKVVDTVFFAEIFERFLKPDSKKSVLEIGCAGGEYLCYMHKHFGFQPFGVDYSDEIVKTAELFRHNQLGEPTLFHEDFFSWHPGRTFDVVFSIGFIEHFQDTRMIIERHARLLSPGGTLIITLPHFAHMQYLFHWLIDRENLVVLTNTNDAQAGALYARRCKALSLFLEHQITTRHLASDRAQGMECGPAIYQT